MSDRLKLHLSVINLYSGERTHGARRGTALVLKMLGMDDKGICQHMGWESGNMLGHYANMGGLCSKNSIASALSSAAMVNDSGVSHLDQLSKDISNFQTLKKFNSPFSSQ